MSAHFSQEELDIFLASVENHMRAMLNASTGAYEAGWAIWKLAFANAPRSLDIAWPLWLMGGALTDMAEVDPARQSEAEAMMRRAAREWFDLPAGNVVSRDDYFDRWVHVEMGYERKGE